MCTTRLIRHLLELFMTPRAASTASQARLFGYKEPDIAACLRAMREEGLVASIPESATDASPSTTVLAITPVGERILHALR